MKIKVTKAEAEAFILQQMQDRGVSAVEISVDANTAEPAYVVAIRKTMTEFPRHLADQKIPAIKYLRELVPGLGLAESKSAVECPDTAIQHYFRTGKWYPNR